MLWSVYINMKAKLKKIKLKKIKQRGHQMIICKYDSQKNAKQLKVMNGKKKILKKKNKRLK